MFVDIENMIKNTYDTIIVGGGIAGLTATVYLAREGQKVLLIEKNRELGGLVNSFAIDLSGGSMGIQPCWCSYVDTHRETGSEQNLKIQLELLLLT